MKQEDSILGKSCYRWEVKKEIQYEEGVKKQSYSINKGQVTFTHPPLYMINNVISSFDEERWTYLNTILDIKQTIL